MAPLPTPAGRCRLASHGRVNRRTLLRQHRQWRHCCAAVHAANYRLIATSKTSAWQGSPSRHQQARFFFRSGSSRSGSFDRRSSNSSRKRFTASAAFRLSGVPTINGLPHFPVATHELPEDRSDRDSAAAGQSRRGARVVVGPGIPSEQCFPGAVATDQNIS